MPQVHIEWGRPGVDQAAAADDFGAVVIVDVLSFSTAVDIATSRGAIVYPFADGDRIAARAFANRIGGLCAGRRSERGPSLAPGSLRYLPVGTRLVLPSPNGSRLSLSGGNCPTFAGCLRNAPAVAEAAVNAAGGKKIMVVAAGERWPDGTLRPAIEDWLGAGQIALYVVGGGVRPTPEAEAAITCVKGLGATAIAGLVKDSQSGLELAEWGHAGDVALATEIGCSSSAPRLLGGGYRLSETIG